jgi:uncharacterized DUF497 family protein
LEFEWNDAKADANFQSHGVSFDWLRRFSKTHVLFVAYSEREERIRIISARRATQYEQDDYFRQNT